MQIIDDVLSDFDFVVVYNYFITKGFTSKHRSDVDKQSPHLGQFAYYCNANNDQQILKKITEPTNIGVYERAYAQIYTPSTITYPHKDITQKTAIYFMHPQYNRDWGGELLIFDKEDETLATAVLPLKNRMVIFDGKKHFHVGRPFNSLASCYRMFVVLNIV